MCCFSYTGVNVAKLLLKLATPFQGAIISHSIGIGKVVLEFPPRRVSKPWFVAALQTGLTAFITCRSTTSKDRLFLERVQAFVIYLRTRIIAQGSLTQ